jgi:hypothetical protein
LSIIAENRLNSCFCMWSVLRLSDFYSRGDHYIQETLGTIFTHIYTCSIYLLIHVIWCNVCGWQLYFGLHLVYHTTSHIYLHDKISLWSIHHLNIVFQKFSVFLHETKWCTKVSISVTQNLHMGLHLFSIYRIGTDMLWFSVSAKLKT